MSNLLKHQSHVNFVDDEILLDSFFDELLLGDTIGEAVFDSSSEIDGVSIIKSLIDNFGYTDFMDLGGDSVHKHGVHFLSYYFG
jgi:hypothetical protein